jgi:hypothetical protein
MLLYIINELYVAHFINAFFFYHYEINPVHKFFSLFYFLFIYSHVHTLFGSFLPPVPHPLPSSLPLFQSGTILPLSLILLKKRHEHNKEDKAFLWVELRRAIQKDSHYFFHVPMCYDPCWFNSNWSLCWFLIPCLW